MFRAVEAGEQGKKCCRVLALSISGLSSAHRIWSPSPTRSPQPVSPRAREGFLSSPFPSKVSKMEYPHQQAGPSSTTITLICPYATRRRKRAAGDDLSSAVDMDVDADAQRATVRTRSRSFPVPRRVLTRLLRDWVRVAAGRIGTDAGSR
jgi:hypothetical protein